MTNRPSLPHHEDDEIVDLDALFDDLVRSDPKSEHEFLRTQWIERTLNQLVSLRIKHNLTQRQLGERIGKPQSSIARIESATDLKLSVVWDYLSGLGLAPDVLRPATPLDDAVNDLHRYSANGSHGLPRMPKYEFHRSAVVKAPPLTADPAHVETPETAMDRPSPDPENTDGKRDADRAEAAA
jgi:transcriptional regulator with XRE-family HTH domain